MNDSPVNDSPVSHSPVSHSIPKDIGPQLPGVGQALMAFDLPDPSETRGYAEGETHRFASYSHGPFLPRGLIVWGATPATFIQRLCVGNSNELEVSGMAVPARYFETGRSFEQIARLARAGELDGALGAHQLTQMGEASPGTSLSITVEGPFESFCLWGNVYLQGSPFLRANVERVKAADRSEDYFRGQLHEVGLAGMRPVLDVTAPDARTAAELLAALRSGPLGRGR